MIFKAIGENLTGLARPSGRAARGQFWPWAITVFLLAMAADILLFVPVMSDMMNRMFLYLRAHPEGFPQPAPGQPPALPPELMPDMAKMAIPTSVVTLIAILLLASAVVRRLHDRDKPGWWGALPLPFQAAAMAMSPFVLKNITVFPNPHPGLLLLSTLNSLAFWGAFIFLIVLLAGDGTRGPNRFGPDPRGGQS